MRAVMRDLYGWGFFLLLAGAVCGLIWPLMAFGIVAMSVAFASVFTYFALKGDK